MANTEVITTILDLVKDMLTYMLPVIGVLAGIKFMISWLMSVTLGMGRQTFKG
jgi:hypothetical protein